MYKSTEGKYIKKFIIIEKNTAVLLIQMRLFWVTCYSELKTISLWIWPSVIYYNLLATSIFELSLFGTIS